MARKVPPFGDQAEWRLPGDEVRYNQIAEIVMSANDIEVNDMYGFALPRLNEFQEPNDVHFKPIGSESLARQVADRISHRLPKGQTRSPAPRPTSAG